MHKPVLERRCICDFCFGAALPAALEAGLVLVDCATAILSGEVFMRSAWWWLGGCVDICTLPLSRQGTLHGGHRGGRGVLERGGQGGPGEGGGWVVVPGVCPLL